MSVKLSNRAYGIVEVSEATQKWTIKSVEAHFEEAVATLKRLPPLIQRGYLNSWPDIVYASNEKISQKKKQMRIFTSSEAISRMNQTFEWMTWVTTEESKLIWKRAERVRWKTICWELGLSRGTVWKRWQIACAKIAAALNASVLAKSKILQNKKCLNIFVVDKNQNKVL